MITPENINRIIDITNQAEQDDITPNEYVRRIMNGAISRGNPFINPQDNFVVLGIDGMDGSTFPCESFPTVEDARAVASHKIGEEHLFSEGDAVSTTFHIFTSDGIHVSLNDSVEDQRVIEE